jgi:hypothetical protein
MSQRQRSIFSWLLPISLPVLSALAIFTKIDGASAVPLYPNDLANNQVVRLQMEKSAPGGAPVTLNITPQYGFKNGGLLNTWIGADNDSLFKYLTNGYGINFQRIDSNYSISVKDTNVTPGNTLNTYQSGFGRYQDWNLEKVGGQYGDTYLFHWRTDLDTNLCLDIRGFGQGQQLNNQIPVVWYCDRNNPNQRIRVIKQGQNPPPQQASNPDISIRLSFNGNFTAAQRNAIQKAAQNWENIITRDMVPGGVLNVNVVDGTMQPGPVHWAETNFPNSYANGQAPNPRQRFNLTGQYNTTMKISRSFLDGPNANQLTKLATHELGHALYLDEASYDGTLGTNSIMNIYPLYPTITEGIYRRLESLGYSVNRNPYLQW